jgi:hypothetical protein
MIAFFVYSWPIMIRELHILANRKPDWATRPPRAFWVEYRSLSRFCQMSRCKRSGSYWYYHSGGFTMKLKYYLHLFSAILDVLYVFWSSGAVLSRYQTGMKLFCLFSTWLFCCHYMIKFCCPVCGKLVQDEVEGRLYVLSFNQISSNLPLNVVSARF